MDRGLRITRAILLFGRGWVGGGVETPILQSRSGRPAPAWHKSVASVRGGAAGIDHYLVNGRAVVPGGNHHRLGGRARLQQPDGLIRHPSTSQCETSGMIRFDLAADTGCPGHVYGRHCIINAIAILGHLYPDKFPGAGRAIQ